VTTNVRVCGCLVCRVRQRWPVAQPANTLSTGVFIDSWLAPLVKEGASFTGLTVDGEGLGAEESVPAAVILQNDGDVGRAVGIGSRGVGQVA